jgi:AraC family transcriptional regulator of adaptative response/methylated-DNA-[protein]-cysteine methyltransferase
MMRDKLPGSRSVTEAIYQSGFNSASRFYANAKGALGMTPKRFRARGVRETIRYAIAKCSLGKALVAASDKGIAAILLGDNDAALKRELQGRFANATLTVGDKAFAKLVANAVAFVDAPAARCTLPLDVRGTAFQQRVWAALRDIAPGSTATYAEIAARIGRPKAVRAVAAACAANPVAIAIPCHRVIRQDGSPAGYRWGTQRKEALLKRETKAKPAKD